MYSYQIRKTFEGFSAVTHRPQARNIGISSSPRFHLLPLLPQPPLSTLSARAAPSSPPRSPAQLQLESSWWGSTLPSHDFSVRSLGLGLPFLAAMTGRVALPVVHRAMGASPATNIRQGYACLFPSLPIPLHEIKHPNP